jgi:hypothetical protein
LTVWPCTDQNRLRLALSFSGSGWSPVKWSIAASCSSWNSVGDVSLSTQTTCAFASGGRSFARWSCQQALVARAPQSLWVGAGVGLSVVLLRSKIWWRPMGRRWSHYSCRYPNWGAIGGFGGDYLFLQQKNPNFSWSHWYSSDITKCWSKPRVHRNAANLNPKKIEKMSHDPNGTTFG